MRRRIIRKNKKRKDPRYFLNENVEMDEVEDAPEVEAEPEAEEWDASYPGAPEIEWSDRLEWKDAQGELGMDAASTTSEHLGALRDAFGEDYNVLDPMNIDDIKKITFTPNEKDLLPLGTVSEDLWVKTGNNKYGFLRLGALYRWDESGHSNFEAKRRY